MPRLWLQALAIAFLCAPVRAFLLGVDLGSQFFKAALVAPGKPFEVVHNQHSKRKTPTAVSFNEKVRTFGDDALASASRGITKTPMFFPLQLGRNVSGVSPEELAWLPKRFYPYSLGVNASGSLRFEVGDGEAYTVEEVAAHVLSFAKGLARSAADGIAVTESILTVPSEATFTHRRAMLAAAKIAGLPRPQLLHETSAAALQRALDLDLSGANGTRNDSMVLFYNMGARHVEACVIQYRGATHMGKSTVAMTVRGCGVSHELGGHLVDMLIAERMLAAFQAKHPKLAEGIVGSVRSLKKLEKEAASLKHVLSANKEGLFRVESLYEDTDFAQPVKREELEAWCAQLFAAFSKPIDVALQTANVTLADLDEVEMIGGGWRIPRIQSLLSEHLLKQRPPGAPAVNLSQHVNGDEAMATGAAFFGANSSVSFRTKKIFFTDATQHGYRLQLAPLNLTQPHEEGWEKSVELFPVGSKLRARKTVKLTAGFDIRASLLENGNSIIHWDLAGVHTAATGKYANLSTPLVSLKLELDASGVVQMSSAVAIFDELVLVEETPPAAPGANATGLANASEAAPEGNETGGSDAASDPEGAEGAEAAESGAANDPNATEPANASDAKKSKTKLKKRKVPLSVVENFEGVFPRPASEAERDHSMERLRLMDEADAEVRRIEGAKNALEAFIYESRDKLNDDESCLKVSTEEERSNIAEMLTHMEEWLYEDEARDANASLLDAKLASLQEHVLPIRKRAWELEQRATLPEIIGKVQEYVNQTLAYVKKNMTWVDVKEIEGVQNLTANFVEWYANVSEQQAQRELTQEPAHTVKDVQLRLRRMQTEAQRLTKIRKIDPVPYSSDYSKHGGYGGYDDPRMRSYYEEMYRNSSRNGSNGSDWWRNFSNFSGFKGWNDSEYMRSYYEHAAQNFSSENESRGAAKEDAGTGAEGGGDKTEL